MKRPVFSQADLQAIHEARTTQWVNSDRTVLVTRYDSGLMTVALREDSGAVWGPPITVREEAA